MVERDFEEYVQKYSSDLTRLCLSLCCNSADAEDLFQDTWYKAIRHYPKYNRELPFDKWLFSICVNTYKNSLKLSYNKNKVEFKSDEEKQAFLNSIPSSDEVGRDDYFELRRAISALPKRQKIVIVLHYFKDYSEREIAQLLNIPEGTVKSRMYAARQSLKGRLNNEG